MKPTSLEIAFIAGGFGITGTVVGIITNHFLSKNLARRTEHNQAVKEFISAFQEELTRLKLDCPTVSIYDIIYPARTKHGRAYDIFKLYLKGHKLKRFSQAWKEYYLLTPICASKEDDKDEDIISLVDKIKALLEFAKFK